MASRTSPVKIRQAERRKNVWDLRKRGLSTRAIAAELGVSQSVAWRDLVAMWAEFAPSQEDADVQRREQHGRLVQYLEALGARRADGTLGDDDRLKLTAGALKIEARIAALWGLDRAPEREQQQQTAIRVELSFGTEQPEIIDQAPLELPPDT